MICISNVLKELDYMVNNLDAVYISEAMNATKIEHLVVFS